MFLCTVILNLFRLLFCFLSDLFSLSREYVERELFSLAKERDSLVLELKGCTGSFQAQIRDMKNTSENGFQTLTSSCLFHLVV